LWKISHFALFAILSLWLRAIENKLCYENEKWTKPSLWIFGECTILLIYFLNDLCFVAYCILLHNQQHNDRNNKHNIQLSPDCIAPLLITEFGKPDLNRELSHRHSGKLQRGMSTASAGSGMQHALSITPEVGGTTYVIKRVS
jgi:hypothetical protein